MRPREELLQSISKRVEDYRAGEISQVSPGDVDAWVRQFDQFGFQEGSQTQLLNELDRSLERYYVTRQNGSQFVEKSVSSKIFGEDVADGLRKSYFLNISTRGSSQGELRVLFGDLLQRTYNLRIEECGPDPQRYVYIDDCLFSGNTVIRDIQSWLPQAKEGAELHLIFLAVHSGPEWYVRKTLKKPLAEKRIKLSVWRFLTLDYAPWAPQKVEFVWPCKLDDNKLVKNYAENLSDRCKGEEKKLKYLLRPENVPKNETVFSSPEARNLFEQALLLAGAFIVSLPQTPNPQLRPLGYSVLESLGFGALVVTYRNIANNCPLALWWGDATAPADSPLSRWRPLFPRRVNVPVPVGIVIDGQGL